VIASGRIEIALPEWVRDVVADHPGPFTNDAAAMALAVDLARGNLDAGDGGPFGAVLVDHERGTLVAIGVNLVLRTQLSSMHAEIVALSLAHKALATWDLSGHSLTLVSSAEPCAMCLGAIPWSGVERLVCAARDADARAAGFDEGDKPQAWPERLRRRGIEVVRDCRRHEAAKVLADYAAAAGTIYNPRG